MTVTMESDTFAQIPIAKIAESTHNPRRRFDEQRMAELTASVREHGVLTPVLVRQQRGKYELAAGHRRVRAARAAGLEFVPGIVRQMDDRKFAEVLNLENLQREDLDELDEAEGYRQLRDLAGYDVAAIALKLSRSEKYVYDRLKLLDLVPEAQELLRRGLIHAGHAILIARLGPKEQAMVIDPDDGGAFTHENPDYRGLFDLHEEDQGNRALARARRRQEDRWAGMKAVTVRELEAWINANVRFDREHVDAVYHPETARTLFEIQQAEEPLKVIPITRLYQVPPSARADERTLSVVSWKRADGQPEFDHRRYKLVDSKVCEHAVKGVVVVGPGRGEMFDICTAKKACRVHWKQERQTSAAGVDSGRSRQAEDKAWKRRAQDRELRAQALVKVMPELQALVRSKVGKLELDATSKPVVEAFRDMGQGVDLSQADCDALLKRSRDGWSAIVELEALGMLAQAGTYGPGCPSEVLRADHMLGGNSLASAYAAALKAVQTSANAAKREAAKAEKAKAKAVAKPKGKSKRVGRSRTALTLVLTLAGALVLLAMGGCNGPGWQRVASTVEVGAGYHDHKADDVLGNPLYSDSTSVWVSVRPLAFLEPPQKVVVVGGKAGGE